MFHPSNSHKCFFSQVPPTSLAPGQSSLGKMHRPRHGAPACKLTGHVMLNNWGEGGAGAQRLMGGLASELFSSNPDGGGVPESWCFSSLWWVCVWRLGPKAKESQTTSSTVTQCWDLPVCDLFSWVCQSGQLRKEMIFISLTDSTSALVTASRSNLLRFLVLPLGTNPNLKTLYRYSLVRGQAVTLSEPHVWIGLWLGLSMFWGFFLFSF